MAIKSDKKKKQKQSTLFLHPIKPLFWFIVGVCFALFCISTFFLIYFRVAYQDKVIPGVFVGETYVGEKTVAQIESLYLQKNKKIGKTKIIFSGENTATVSADDLDIGYDAQLIATQAMSIGKSTDIFSNAYYIINSYLNGAYLPVSYTSSPEKLTTLLAGIQKKVYVQPVDALFQVEGNRVVAFKQSSPGATIDFAKLTAAVNDATPRIVSGKTKQVVIPLAIKVIEPAVSTEKANKLGIVEEIGTGTSLFAHSIPGRIHNVALAASKISGVLVAPDETFSFDKNLGDVSQYTGYQQAYVIQNGKTVLGDGGGVCQVSTTLFRAALNAGLPIVERTAHAYRVGYYEEDSPPGLDATVYYPTVDLKFKNDTGHYILIVAATDLNNLRLTFTLYGKKDGRQVVLTTPVITSQTPAPPDVYQDDPTLPAGQTKQVDFAAAGANVVFSRTVTRDGKIITQDTYKSNYRPWQAIFLRGTKQG